MPTDINNYIEIDEISHAQRNYKLVDSGARESINQINTTITSILDGNSRTPDTKNTAGATPYNYISSEDLLFLIGANSQTANPQTYTDSRVYLKNNHLYISKDSTNTSTKVLTENELNNTGTLINNNATIPTEQTVKNFVEGKHYLSFKGEIFESSDLPTVNVQIGDTYRITEEGQFVGLNCRPGDLIIATTNSSPIIWIVVHSSADPSSFVTSASGGLIINNQEVMHENLVTNGGQSETAFYPIAFDDYGHIIEYGTPVDLETLLILRPATDAPSPIGSTALVGYSTDYARADHVHSIDISEILGYQPYDGDSNPNGYTHIAGVQVGGAVVGPDDETGIIDITSYMESATAGVVAGSGLVSDSSSGIVTFNHASNVTAQSTQAVYPITINNTGHITSYGNAVDLTTLGGAAFRTVRVNSAADIVADGVGSTLNLNAGNNVTLIAQPSTDTITISATGGGGGAISDMGITYTDTQRDNIGLLNFTTTEDPEWTGVDEKVYQAFTNTGNAEYRILFSNTANNTEETAQVRKTDGLLFNPGTNTLTTSFIKSKINTVAEAGYIMDLNGNLLHKRNNSSDSFDLKAYSTTSTKNSTLKMYYDTGDLITDGSITINGANTSTGLLIGKSTNRYQIEGGYQYLWVRDSGTDNTAPSVNNTNSSTVLTPNSIQIGNAYNFSSSSLFTKKSELTADKLIFRTRTTAGNSNTETSYTWGPSLISALGTIKENTNITKSLSSGTTLTNITNFSLEAGTWIVMAFFRTPSNDTTGYRSVCISTTSGGEALDSTCLNSGPATNVSGKASVKHIVTVLHPTSTTTYYINAWQNSGSTLSITSGYKAIKIK